MTSRRPKTIVFSSHRSCASRVGDRPPLFATTLQSLASLPDEKSQPRAALCARRSFVLHAQGCPRRRLHGTCSTSVSERLSSMRLEAPANVSLPPTCGSFVSTSDCLLARLRVLRCSARSEGQRVDHHRANYCARAEKSCSAACDGAPGSRAV